jgi:hypothetical protein
MPFRSTIDAEAEVTVADASHPETNPAWVSTTASPTVLARVAKQLDESRVYPHKVIPQNAHESKISEPFQKL